jgi:hypothetical protein
MSNNSIWKMKAGNLASSKFISTILFMFMVTICFVMLMRSSSPVVLPIGYWVAYIGAMEASLAVYGGANVIEKHNQHKADKILKS